MVAWSRSAKCLKKSRSRNAQEVLEQLKGYLEGAMKEPVRMLCGFWKDQQDVISYQELREAVKEGELNEETYRQWSQDYSVLVTKHLKPVWEDAIRAGAMSQPVVRGLPFDFQLQTSGIMNWIKDRGAAFVTAASDEQKHAIQALLAKKMVEGHTVDELAKYIRPCIGLTEAQARANRRYYDHMVKTLKEDHPRMQQETVEKKAREAAAKYAERQHRQRAMTIAQTESAFAYNRGADEGVRQAQAQNLLGKMVKRWSTSGDDGVCDLCAALEGVEIGMDDSFDIKGKVLFTGHHMLPPAHPRCACAVEYIEVEPPAFADIPQMHVDITQADSLREYTTEEIENIAAQTEAIISRYIATPSKWSGNLLVTDEGIQNTDGHITYYGKMWSCDILTKHETAPAVMIHEQLHARSISHYGQKMYIQFSNIEESTVQLMTEEICRQNGIETIESDYQFMVDSLKKIGRYIGIHQTDFDFAKFMIETPVSERLGWLSDRLYDTLGRDINVTIEEYQNWSELLDVLYAKG